MNRFWEVEAVDSKSMSPDQQACEDHFVSHIKQQQDGRYVVRLPLKIDSKELGTSRHTAESRLMSLERRLGRDSDLKHQYHNFMKDYETAGHMKAVQPQSAGITSYYLSHHQADIAFQETLGCVNHRVFRIDTARNNASVPHQRDSFSMVLRQQA